MTMIQSMNAHRCYSSSASINSSSFISGYPIRSLVPFSPTKQFTKFTAITCCTLSPPLLRPQYIPNRITDPNYVLGVDIIEARFPASSEADLEAVRLITQQVGNSVTQVGHTLIICGLARCNKSDIDAAWEAVKHAKKPRIHTFIATSEIYMKYKLKKSKVKVIERARSMVSYARILRCEDVEFSPEDDAGRSEREYLYEILGEVIKAGATTLNIPDTVLNYFFLARFHLLAPG